MSKDLGIENLDHALAARGVVKQRIIIAESGGVRIGPHVEGAAYLRDVSGWNLVGTVTWRTVAAAVTNDVKRNQDWTARCVASADPDALNTIEHRLPDSR